jgi:hypothetical protein
MGSLSESTLKTALFSTLVADWAVEINALLAQGKEGVIQLARTVHTAKAKLPYGQWSALWKSGQVPFSKRKAEMLAVIGKSLGWVDAQISAYLPSAWNTLYHVARLDETAFKTLLEQGAIHSKLTLQQAKDLLAVSRGKNVLERESDLTQRLKRFSDFVRAHRKEWSATEREQACVELSQLVDELSEPDHADHRVDELPNRLDEPCSKTPFSAQTNSHYPRTRRNSCRIL